MVGELILTPVARLINTRFHIGGEPLEPVKSFCYLGFEVVPSGIVMHAMNTLNDKAKKALHPLLSNVLEQNTSLSVNEISFQYH